MPTLMPLRDDPQARVPAWPCAPWFDGPWREVPSHRIAVIAAAATVGEADGWDRLPSPIERMRALPLDCYPEWSLVEALTRFSANADGVFRALLGPGGCRRLDGSSAVLHAMNPKHLSAGLSAEAAAQYLLLFSSAVRGEEGRFRIVTSTAQLQKAEGQTLRKFRPKVDIGPLEPQPTEDGFSMTACVIYGAALFRSEFIVTPSGAVEMTNDDLLVPDLPVVAERFHEAWQIFDDAPSASPARVRSRKATQ